MIDVISRENPLTVLDVGCGWGKFGVLTREYSRAEKVDAVDVIQPRYPVYDHAYQGDLRDLLQILPQGTPRYDLALFIEVLEHLEKEEGWKVIGQLLQVARRVLITTPLGFRPQEFAGLPYETHRSGWYPWEFGRLARVRYARVYPAHYSRHLRLPSHWQQLVLLEAKG